jgi:hypothetical protein
VEDRGGEPSSPGAGVWHEDWDVPEAFDDVWLSLTFSRQGDRGDEECSAAHRWRLVSEFVESIHPHRSAHFSSSELVSVDGSMSRWYGQGGHWIEHGLPQYVAIDRKPENGCEI